MATANTLGGVFMPMVNSGDMSVQYRTIYNPDTEVRLNFATIVVHLFWGHSFPSLVGETNMARKAKTPWHLWVVGGLTLFWNGFGAYDYVMTQTRNMDYLGAFPQEQLDYFFGFPTWYVALWAIAIWTSVAGSALLLLRTKWAVPVLLVSLIAFVLNAVYSIIIHPMPGAGMGNYIFSLVIFVILLVTWLYARWMRKKGVLN